MRSKDIKLTRVKTIELKAMRCLRGVRQETLSKVAVLKPSDIKKYENLRYEGYVPRDVARKYVENLGIKMNEYNRLKKYLSGESGGFEVEREIPEKVKNAVKKRDKNMCGNCGSKNKLHFHHKKYFSNGGLHTTENLIILCADCHAEAHKNDPFYKLVKSLSK